MNSGVSHKNLQENTNLNSISNPRGNKEGRASFPTESPYKFFKNPWPRTSSREGREELERENKEGGGRLALSVFLLCPAPQAPGGAPAFLSRGQLTHPAASLSFFSSKSSSNDSITPKC
jgi:hypothetical protein